MTDDHRKSDNLVKWILLLLGLLQSIITIWAFNISAQTSSNTSRLFTLEANYGNMKSLLEEVRTDVKILINRK